MLLKKTTGEQLWPKSAVVKKMILPNYLFNYGWLRGSEVIVRSFKAKFTRLRRSEVTGPLLNSVIFAYYFFLFNFLNNSFLLFYHFESDESEVIIRSFLSKIMHSQVKLIIYSTATNKQETRISHYIDQESNRFNVFNL